MTERLGERRVAWLTALPPIERIDVRGLGPVLFCHGSPRSDEDVVTAVSDPDRVAPMLAGTDEEVVVSGHTHVQFDRSVAGHRLINAGSIGMPYQGVAGRAFWTILDADAAAASGYLKRERDVLLRLRFSLGAGRCTFWTSDLTYEYVRLNAEYTT